MKCKWCDNEVDTTKLSKYASGNYCSKICARKYAQSKNNNNELKQGNCSVCGKEMWVKKQADTKKIKCDECKWIEKNTCKYCSQLPCKRSDVCKKHQIFPALIKYFGFNENKIGTIDVYEEFDRVKNMLIEDYWDKELSMPDMVEKYNHYHVRNFVKILKSLDIDTRNLEQAGLNTYKNKIVENYSCNNNYNYKQGWHKTWNNKDVFYRSSYELEYAEQLDEQQIDYDMENLRIVYWDSQLLRQRIAIPDFYLPKSNTIVEIKSNYTYDEQNWKDRIKAYKEHGYEYKLILEKEEFSPL